MKTTSECRVELIDEMGSDLTYKVCAGCDRNLTLDNFPTRKDRSGRLRPYCRECANDVQRARYAHHKKSSPFKHRCSRARTRARRLKVPFNLTPDYLESLWTGKCPVTGVGLNLDTDRKDEAAAELDRFIPEKGYTIGNVAWLSRKANRVKNNTDLKLMKQLIKWMESYENSK